MKNLVILILLITFSTIGCSDLDERENIYFIGDSITDFNNFDPYFPQAYNNYKIWNHGKGGYTTHKAYFRIVMMNDYSKASKIFIMLGVNDFRYQLTLEQSEYYYRAILDHLIKYSNAEIFIQSVLPVNYEELNNFVVSFNEMLREVADDYEIEYLNIHEVFNVNGENPYTSDGVHPTKEGYDVWMNYLKINEYL